MSGVKTTDTLQNEVKRAGLQHELREVVTGSLQSATSVVVLQGQSREFAVCARHCCGHWWLPRLRLLTASCSHAHGSACSGLSLLLAAPARRLRLPLPLMPEYSPLLVGARGSRGPVALTFANIALLSLFASVREHFSPPVVAGSVTGAHACRRERLRNLSGAWSRAWAFGWTRGAPRSGLPEQVQTAKRTRETSDAARVSLLLGRHADCCSSFAFLRTGEAPCSRDRFLCRFSDPIPESSKIPVFVVLGGHRQRNRFLGRFSDLILGSYRALDFHLSNYKLTSKDSLDNPTCGVV